MEKIKNKYGLIIGEQKKEDYVFGASPLSLEILQADGNWEKFLPVVENQSTPTIESMACTVFTTLNCVEILIKRLYNK